MKGFCLSCVVEDGVSMGRWKEAGRTVWHEAAGKGMEGTVKPHVILGNTSKLL